MARSRLPARKRAGRSRHSVTRMDSLEQRNYFAFGLTTSGSNLIVDNGAAVVFTVNSTNGDLTSIKRNGTELHAPFSATNRYSHINSGLGSVTTTTQVDNTNGWIKITCTAGSLTQYYIVRRNYNDIVMATYASALPAVGELRFITYLDRSKLTSVNPVSDISGKTAIEGSDVYANSSGQTFSKFYSAKPFIDDPYHGVTGSGHGVWMMTPNREHSSGGPFFQDINEQATSSQSVEVYTYMYSGHTQTEAFRPGLHIYGLEINGGAAPVPIDFSFLSGLGLTGYVAASGRGTVIGKAIGNYSGERIVVGLSNSSAQYWGVADPSTQNFSIGGVKPGTYTQTVYKDQLAVATKSVTVTAGTTITSNITSAEVVPAALWTVGTWDGRPEGFRNASNIPTMHPSDTRNSSWGPVTHTIGSSANSNFPALQWKTGVNNPTKIVFNLASSPSGTYTLRVGLTISQFGARPVVTVNPGQSYQWTSSVPAIPVQPDSRGITRGTTRGNNVTFTYSIPASSLRTGTNQVQIDVASGSSGTTYLSPGWAYDAVDFTAGTVALAAAASSPPSGGATTKSVLTTPLRHTPALFERPKQNLFSEESVDILRA